MNIHRLWSLALATAVAVTPVTAPAASTAALPKRAAIPTPEPSPIMPPVPPVGSGSSAPDIRPTTAEIAGVTQQPFVGIALSDAIGMALSRNSDLAIATGNTRIAGYQIAAARGAYDVTFQVEPSVTHSTTAPLNQFFAGPNFGPIVQNTQSLQAGLSGQLPSGTQYNVSIVQERVDNNTAINAFNPYYYATLNATITQPLLKGAGAGNETRHAIQVAVLSQAATQEQTLATVSTTIAAVENAYWDLLAGWRNVAIQEDALHQSILQQQSNVRLAQQERGAPIDAVESSAQVAVYQSDVFAALQNVSSLQNQLKALIVNDPGDPIWRANLVPTTPVQQTPNAPALFELLALAMKNRPELAQAIAQQQQAEVDVAYARNQTRPQVNLQLTYTGNGFAGNALPPLGGPFGNASPPPYLGGALGGAYGNIGRLPTYSAGVVIQAPLGDHTAKANLAIAQQQERNAQISTENVDQRVQTDVLNALQNYRTALASLYSARRAREAAEAVYASELRKFHNARSTTFLVTQHQLTLVQDQDLELEAQTNLNKAIVELQRVDGTILSANDVTLTTLLGH